MRWYCGKLSIDSLSILFIWVLVEVVGCIVAGSYPALVVFHLFLDAVHEPSSSKVCSSRHILNHIELLQNNSSAMKSPAKTAVIQKPGNRGKVVRVPCRNCASCLTVPPSSPLPSSPSINKRKCCATQHLGTRVQRQAGLREVWTCPLPRKISYQASYLAKWLAVKYSCLTPFIWTFVWGPKPRSVSM